MRYITILFVLLMIATAADRDLAGRYSGDWKSSGSGGNGSFRLSLEPAPDGTWKCEVTFTFAGEEVKTIMREVKVEQSKLEAAYDFSKSRKGTEGTALTCWPSKLVRSQTLIC